MVDQVNDTEPTEEVVENGEDSEEAKGRVYPCKYCDRVFITSQAFGGHQNSHRRERLASKMASMLQQQQQQQRPYAYSNDPYDPLSVRPPPPPPSIPSLFLPAHGHNHHRSGAADAPDHHHRRHHHQPPPYAFASNAPDPYFRRYQPYSFWTGRYLGAGSAPLLHRATPSSNRLIFASSPCGSTSVQGFGPPNPRGGFNMGLQALHGRQTSGDGGGGRPGEEENKEDLDLDLHL